MAKKNSSKTATEKSIQASEPRVITYKGWQGVNYVDAPLTWEPLETGQNKFRQTNLPDNYLMVQNNVCTSDTLSLETRMDSEIIGLPPRSDLKFTGVACVYKKWLFCAVRNSETDWSEKIIFRDLTKNTPSSWRDVYLRVGSDTSPVKVKVCEIGFFEGNMVVTARDYRESPGVGVLMLAEVSVENDVITIKGKDWYDQPVDDTLWHIVDTPKISPTTNRPGVKPTITVKGMAFNFDRPTDKAPNRVEVKFCYTNRLGSTLTQTDGDCATVYVELSPALWTTKKYITIKPAAGDSVPHRSVSGIDLYARELENLDWVFIGHVNVTKEQVTNGNWKYNWYGNMTDITQWLTAQLMVPTDNTTHGPDATYFACHDSRMYYWGMPSKPYRLWIGGNPGAEFSIARGLGGAWVDIEPGSGYDVKGTAKWKTVSGANIVTIMCGNENTTKIKRFNLVETNLTLTNEVAYKSYMYEEVSNVVGCNSRWGYGVFTEGLYSINRYGLMLTTMAMEYNSQMKNQSMSEVIEPIFTNVNGKQLRDGRMVCINDVIYIAFSDDTDSEYLDNVILCYDINLKAWYTWTHDQTVSDDSSTDTDHVLHIFAVDSDERREGLGVVTETEVRLYPVTGTQPATVPPFIALIETGELAPRHPMQAFWYIQQLEFRFDYLVGDPNDPATILVEGVDYYGRQFKIEKKINIKSRGHHGLTGEQRDFVEWIRIDKLVESFRIRIKGKVRFRLTHINAKLYQQADTIGTPYGFDARDTYYNRKGQDHEIHHYIDDYNNLRRAVVS